MKNSAKKVLKFSLIGCFIVFILGYAFFRAKDIVFGVKIKNVEIVRWDGAENIVNISANAKNAVILTLQDREISIDKDGNFKETIALLPGYNIIEIRAEDKFGKNDEKNYQLTYSPVEQPI